MPGFRESTWAMVEPSTRNTLVEAHLCSFSAGSLSGCRRGLTRLQDWLVDHQLAEACAGFDVEAGVLVWCAKDLQSTSRSPGLTIPMSLKNQWGFAMRNLKLPLSADDSVVCCA